MTYPAVFTAGDSKQRQHLLDNVGVALDLLLSVAYVAENSYEGDETSVYLFSFYDVGFSEGYRYGRDRGRKRGIDEAFDHIYGDKAADVAARVQARRKRRTKAKRR